MTSVETVRSRDRLLAAATTLFYERGFLATSVKEITQACGFTQGALYNHFPSKDELLYELVLDIHAELERHTVQARKTAGDDPVDQYAALVAVHVAAHSLFRERSRVGNHEYRLNAFVHGAPDRLESGSLYLYIARSRSRMGLIGIALKGLVCDIKRTESVEDFRFPMLESAAARSSSTRGDSV